MSNRRASTRKRTLKAAKILLGKASVPCTVRDLSEGGACLQLQSTFGIPAVFDVSFDDRKPRACKVLWLNETQVRVQFR
jgi:hypothetical protein